MKLKFQLFLQKKSKFYFAIAFFLSSLILLNANVTSSSFNEKTHLNNFGFELNDDSTTINFGDTIAVIQDGGDTVIILNDYVDSMNSNRLISTSDIIIALTNNQSTIQKGTYGLNIADIFFTRSCP
mgnify:FL=1